MKQHLRLYISLRCYMIIWLFCPLFFVSLKEKKHLICLLYIRETKFEIPDNFPLFDSQLTNYMSSPITKSKSLLGF